MRRTKVIVALLAVMTALIVVSAAPAMAKGNGVKEERNETPRQQAQEERHFNNDGFIFFNNGFNNDDFGDFDFINDNNFFANCGFGFDFGFENCGFPFFNSFGFVDDNNFFFDDFDHRGVDNGVFQRVG